METESLRFKRRKSMMLADRVRGCILGGAVGDALGAPIEFDRLDAIRRHFGHQGITGYVPAYGRKGAITDDTQMTLWTIEGLIRADNRFRDRGLVNMPVLVWRAYQRWLATQEGADLALSHDDAAVILTGWLYASHALDAVRAPGTTCLAALRSGAMGTMDHPINDRKGCGGIMRIAPVGLVSSDPFRDGCDIAALTHGHPTGYLAAGAFALIINRLLHGVSLSDATAEALQVLGDQPGNTETVQAIQKALAAAEQKAPSAETVGSLGEGWVAEEALAIALYCALVADDFLSGVLLAVNHSGDSDSTGSLAGQLLGTRQGVAGIPPHLLEELEHRDLIATLSGDLIQHFIVPDAPPDDCDRYPPW